MTAVASRFEGQETHFSLFLDPRNEKSWSVLSNAENALLDVQMIFFFSSLPHFWLYKLARTDTFVCKYNRLVAKDTEKFGLDNTSVRP